jgi:hypothetical protein
VSAHRSPRAELAAVVRACAADYRAQRGLTLREERVLRAIAACRTEAMGGHLAVCEGCRHEHYQYHSCRDRHCPKCQTQAKEQWLQRQRAQLLPVPYFHVVFTLPHSLNGLVQANARLLYALLFESTAQTLQSFANNPRWLGGELGFTLVLHTWSQTLTHHPHVHGLVAGGALSPDGQWRAAKPGFLFPVQALSRVFRGKYLQALTALHRNARLHLPETLKTPREWDAWVAALRQQPWVVYLKPPLGGPEQVLQYLARYTHRVAISNERFVHLDAETVSFRYRPPQGSATQHKKIMRLTHQQFLARFLLHVLPGGFKRIRHYGLTANRSKAAKLAQSRLLLKAPAPNSTDNESAAAFLARTIACDPTRCPRCHAPLRILRQLPRPARLPDLRATGPPDHR